MQSLGAEVEEVDTVIARGPVVLEVPAHPSFLSVLRATASVLAARLEFTLEELDELRIAVDEAASILLQGVDGEGLLRCRFDITDETIGCELSRSTQEAMEDPASFGWLLLKAVADDVEVLHSADGVAIRLTARRDNDPRTVAPHDGRPT